MLPIFIALAGAMSWFTPPERPMQAGCLPLETHLHEAFDGTQGDGFGSAARVAGALAIAGAWLDDDGGASAGSAHVFDLQSGRTLLKLVPADGRPDAIFGAAVALDGNRALVGAPFDDAPTPASGSAYLFDLATGQQLAKITPNDGSTGDIFGASVALRDGLVAIGSPNDLGWTGSVYLFDAETGAQVQKLLASGAQPQHYFGSSVALSGDAVIGGSPAATFFGSPGAAYVFRRLNDGPNGWIEAAVLAAPDPQNSDWFGRSVSLHADTAVVGSPQHDQGSLSNAGAAYVFQRDAGGPGAWGLVATLTAPEPAADDHFGASVSISGDFVLVGCPYDDGAFVNTGAAYLFQRDQDGPDQWGLAATLTASDAAWLDNFGNAVSIDGDRAVVGAVFKDTPAGSNTGAVYVFELGCTPACPQDISGDGVVAVEDLVAVITAWGACKACPADQDGDGQVAVTDLVAVLTAWGDCPE